MGSAMQIKTPIFTRNTPHPHGLIAAKRAAIPPGCCIFCEEPIRPDAGADAGARALGRKRLICRSYECERAYQRSYYRDRRRGVLQADERRRLVAIELERLNESLRWCAGGADDDIPQEAMNRHGGTSDRGAHGVPTPGSFAGLENREEVIAKPRTSSEPEPRKEANSPR